MHHHVERGGPAGAGEHIAIDDVEVLRDLEVRIARAKGLEIFPVDRAAPPGEQAGFREKERAAADGADNGAVTCDSPQLVMELDAALDLGRFQTGAGDDHVDLAELRERALGRDRDSIAGLHGLAIGRNQLPLEECRSAQTVGGTQRLDAGCKPHHRETGHEQERYSNRLTGPAERHVAPPSRQVRCRAAELM